MVENKTTKIMKMGIIVFLVCGSLLVSFSQAQEQNNQDLVTGNLEFATNLYRKVASTTDDNIFFSPLSVSGALAALSTGVRGPAHEQLLKGLNLGSLGTEIPKLFQGIFGPLNLEQATAFFVLQQAQVNKEFSDLVKQFFGAEVSSVDFSRTQASKSAINDYFKSKMGDRMKAVISYVDSSTQLMLVNTIFFKGKWGLPFNSSFTQEERFYVNKYNIAQVPMMFRADKYYLAYDPSLKLGVLKLPYQADVAMLLLLPDKDVDYTSIDEELTSERILGWIKKLKKTKLEVQMPKFKLEQLYAIHNFLPELGITDIFDKNADLSGLVSDDLKVSEVLHKAVVEVDDQDTTGASTVSSLQESAMPPRLVVNRPFLFLIYHEVTNSLLFIGRVIDPTKN